MPTFRVVVQGNRPNDPGRRPRIPVETQNSPPGRYSPSRRKIAACSASQSLAAVSATVSSTGCRSKVERLMTFSTSLVAVWYSSDFLKIARAGLQRAIRLGAGDGDHRLLGERLQQLDLAV